MIKGGIKSIIKSDQLIRFTGLAVPIVLIIYGVLSRSFTPYESQIIDRDGFFVLMFWWLYIGVLQFLVPSKNKLDTSLRLIAYHLLASSYLIFTSGVASPFAACWILLIIVSYLCFSRIGLWLSTITLVAVVCVDILMWYQSSVSIIILDLTSLLAVVTTGLMVIGFIKSQETNKEALIRSKIQESLQRDRVITIVNNLTDAVLSTDMNGIVKLYNAASLSLLDTNDSLNGKHIDDLVPLYDQTGKEISLFKESQDLKIVIKRDDLEYRYNEDDIMRLEVTLSPIRSSFNSAKKAETHDGYIFILRDITKSKSLEEERDEFISVVSHELRTPITIAEGTISNVQMMMQHPNVTTDMVADAINLAHDQVVFLASMVNDLSTLSRAERGVSDSAEEIDVKDLAHQLITKYTEEARAKKLHLNLDLAPKTGTISCSRLYLEELLQNFITNAIKYTKKGSVTLKIDTKSDKINFTITDTGIGISKSDQKKVYDKFFRSEDYRTRETGGTGLGLYIAAKLAHKLGTKIHLTSRINFGSSFSISLPITKTSTTEPKTETKD